MAQDKPIPKYLNFIFGGCAGMAATCVIQPLDLIKNRMQLSGMGTKSEERPTSFQIVRTVIKNEGVLGLYNGLSAGLFRQVTYTTSRLGVFSMLMDTFSTPEHTPGFAAKAAMGMCAGVVGAFFGTPADLALIRMTSDGRLPVAERRNYSSVFDAMARIRREEGVLALWRGVGPTMGRSMVVNAAQLATYTQSKEFLLGSGYFKDNIGCHFVASMISGIVTTIASMPVDIAKTRIQSAKIIDGKPEFTGAIDVLSKVVRNEGIFALWKGFTPYYARLGPMTVLIFIFLEQFKSLYRKYAMDK